MDRPSAAVHYVYLDDGLYTGSRARKDITECLYQLPRGSRLDVFYFVSGQKGLCYAKNQLSNLSDQNGVFLHMHSLNVIQNNQKYITHTYLWPNQSLQEIDDIREFQDYLEGLGKKCEKNLYRSSSWENDAGLFTSVENRSVVEKEFLLEGIKIVRNVSKTKGMYPLGYNLWPSFGFGSFCAFDMNISNTCPLVLWWGNVVKRGDGLDCWYPLLPRRRNSEVEQIEKYSYEIEELDTPDPDQYNMCPDCGCYFGIETDGGNGFCIHCAWQH